MAGSSRDILDSLAGAGAAEAIADPSHTLTFPADLLTSLPPGLTVFNERGEQTIEQFTSWYEIMDGMGSAVSFATISDGQIRAGGHGKLIPQNPSSPDVTLDTRFVSASLAKPVVAYAIMRILHAQDLSLDDSIDRFLPRINTAYPIGIGIRERKVTEPKAAQRIAKIAEHDPARALELIAQFKAYAKRRHRHFNMSDIDALEKQILDQHEFLYGTYKVQQLLQKFTGKGVTFRQLLSHTAGIRGTRKIKSADPNLDKFPSSRELSIELLRTSEVVVADPLQRTYAYSNTGYIILRCLLESILQKPFAQIMHENVFEPLEMDKSSFSQHEYLSEFWPTVYYQSSDGEVLQHISLPTGCGGMLTTGEDYAKFMRELMRIHQLPESETTEDEQLLQEMFNPQCEDEHETSHYLGIAKQGPTLWGHAGASPSVVSNMFFDPERGTGIVVFLNSRNECAKNRIIEALQAYHGWETHRRNVQTLPAREHAHYTGEYQISALGTIRIYSQEENLFLDMPNPNNVSTRISFVLAKNRDGTIIAHPLTNKFYMGIKLEFTGEANTQLKITPFDPRYTPQIAYKNSRPTPDLLVAEIPTPR